MLAALLADEPFVKYSALRFRYFDGLSKSFLIPSDKGVENKKAIPNPITPDAIEWAAAYFLSSLSFFPGIKTIVAGLSMPVNKKANPALNRTWFL